MTVPSVYIPWIVNYKLSHYMSHRISLVSLFLIVLTSSSSFAAEPIPKVLVIGIDGCRPDALEAARTPNLDALIEAGAIFKGTDIRKPESTDKADTISGPGWSNLLTGVWPDKHHVLDNAFTDPNYEQYPHMFARLKEVRPNAVTASFSTWGPIESEIVSAANISRNFSDPPDDYVRWDLEAATACAEYLETADPDLVVCYQGEVDGAGHAHGFHPTVPEYITAIETVDQNVGKLVDAIQSRANANEDWLIIVCTDHGGSGTGHGNGHAVPDIRTTFLIVSGAAAKRGTFDTPTWQVDVVPTALKHLRVPLSPQWKLDGHAVGLKETSTETTPANSSEPPQGFTPLFNGTDLSGWKGLVGNPETRAAMTASELSAAQKEADELMRAHWNVVDEVPTTFANSSEPRAVRHRVLQFDGKGQSLCTTKDYGDFELYVDWKILDGGDSGIYLRGSPQVQIWDTEFEDYFRHGAENGSGAFWNNQDNPRFPLVKADKPVGQWNRFFIRMIGERATIKLNDQLVADNVVMENIWNRDLPIYPRGQIELQNHGNTLYFRNIYIREIPPSEANTILAKQAADVGFKSIFNGEDFNGWAGDLENYDVVDGTIVCKEGKGGTIFTKEEYADFVARLEFKLPPGGNNGLAIRYAGEGQPHLEGIELQVLDSEDAQYAELDPRQYHGSAYGLVAAHRGYLRPNGEWNFQQVTVRGSQLKVELNGFTILDADLSEVQESKDGPVPAGARRKSGHFGFAGHNDPVAFRNISIRELPGAPARPPSRDTAVSPTDGPIKLFNGRNLEGFYTWIRDSQYSDPKQVFTVKDGMLHISGDGYGGLITNRSYRDYHLIVEFKWGDKTWGERVDRARDSGVLVHGWGPDGGYANTWMASIEAQIIEGGVGDILVLTGSDPVTGQVLPTSLTAEIQKDRDGEKVWKKDGERITLSSGRINWFGRDVDWADKIGFRGKDDVESPHGEWTRLEVIADGGHLHYKVNGVIVNEAFEAKPDFGKLVLQTEDAEMFVRRYELWPLGEAPTDALNQ